jgi:putative phosphoribosyl transferase
MHLKSSKPVVLGLPRGGVPVAEEVARALEAPLDVIIVRKLGLPGHPEYAIGGIGEGDIVNVDWQVVSETGVTAPQLARVVERERAELRRRVAIYRDGRDLIDIEGRLVIIVDDGIATGSTVIAAVKVARDLGARSVVVATPVAPTDTVGRLRRVANEVVVLETPTPFYAVGQAYADFSQTRDSEVRRALGRTHATPFSRVLKRPA